MIVSMCLSLRGGCVAVVHSHVGDNIITGTLPTELGQLTALRYM